MSLYDVLLVDPNATLDEIKLAFKRRALQVHPDKGGSKEEFHLVYQALETLGDPAARKKYDHSLATTKTGPAPHAPHPQSRKRKREEKHAQQATSCKAKTETKPTVPVKKSTTFAGKARSRPTQATAKATPGKKSATSSCKAPSSSKPPRAAATATPAEPQSKQTKLLMKIRDLLKQLPRDTRNDVITNQFSQKQRVLLEKFMVDNAGTSSSQGHSEVKALAPAAGKIAPHQAEFETETSPREAAQRTEDSSHGSCLVAFPAPNSAEANPARRFAHSMEKTRHPKNRTRTAHGAIGNEAAHLATSSTMQASAAQSLPIDTITEISKKAPMNEMPGEGCYALAIPTSKHGCRPHVRMTRAKMKAKDKKTFNAKARSTGSGCVQRAGPRSSLYSARIRFDSFQMRTGHGCDLKTALEDLMILTSVKQKMRNHTGAGTFVERLQAAMVSSAAEHGRDFKDLKLSFSVLQAAGCFIGTSLRSPSVRSLAVFGKMRSVLEPFRQYANQIGGQANIYWRYSPVHLEDAWERFQSAVAQAWELAGVDSTAILQKICSLYEAQAPFRSANLQRWEQQHMARQDKNKHRPRRLQERNPAGRLECWERRRMAMEDKNNHRPKKFRERNPTRRLECWERRQMAMEDKNKHRPKKLRERNPTASLECSERRKMAREDKNEHRPKKMQKRNPTYRLECWERQQMAMEDKNNHRPKKLQERIPTVRQERHWMAMEDKKKHRPRKMQERNPAETISMQLSALKKLIVRWGHMLKREASLLEKERQRVISQRKAQQKDQEEQRRADALNEKRQREEEEGVRKRMRSDITMHGKGRKKSKMQIAIPKYAQGWSSVHLKYSQDILLSKHHLCGGMEVARCNWQKALLVAPGAQIWLFIRCF